MPIELGLFDIMQIDPLDSRSHGEVFRQRLAELRLADELGFHYYFCAERHFLPQYRGSAGTPWIAAATQVSHRIRLGVLAYTLPLHQPSQLAEEISALDWLSDGRLEVGIGLGHRIEELLALGIDVPNRIRIFQERLAIMEALWSGAAVTLKGHQTTVENVAINPLPQQEPQPPIWFAGGDSGSAAWAGQAGLSLAVGFKPNAMLKPVVTTFRETANELANDSERNVKPRAGRVALMRQVYLAPTDEEAFDEMARDLIRLNTIGTETDPANVSAEERDKAAHAVHELIADEIFVAGSPATVAESISNSKAELDLDVFLANPYAAGVDDARLDRCLRLLAKEVAPAIS